MRSSEVKRRAAVALLLLLGCSCISTSQAVRPGGDDAVVTLNSGVSHHVELLAVTHGDLYFLHCQHVWRCPLADLSRVRVEGYNLRTAKYVALGTSGLVDAGISVAAIALNAWPLAPIPAALFLVGACISLTSGPRTGFSGPLTDSARARLALYCRYPQGLTEEQWVELLGFFHQDGFLVPGGVPKP